MAASTSTASATSPHAPSAKKRRKRSSTNLRNPQTRSRKTESPMPPCLSCKNPRKRNLKRKSRKKRNRKKSPSHLNSEAPARPLSPEVRCEPRSNSRSSPLPPLLHKLPLPPQPCECCCSNSAANYLRSDSRENLHSRREHHRRRHAHHSRWKNRGGRRRLGHPRWSPGDRRERTAGLPGIVRPDYPDGFAGDRRRQRHRRFDRDRKLQPGRCSGHCGVSLERTHSRPSRGGPQGSAYHSRQRQALLPAPRECRAAAEIP